MDGQDENSSSVTPGQTSTTSTPFLHRNASSLNFNDLNDEELQVLTNLALNALKNRGILYPPPIPPTPKPPDIFDNANYEQIACACLQPTYNGSPDELILTLNMIHIRHLNKVWYAAMFLFQGNSNIDLVRRFSQVKQETVQNKARELWDNPNSMTLRHTREMETYNSRLLALFLTNLLTADFAALLHSQIGPIYSTDGPTLLFTMCNHIHSNHLAFVESIKNKIRLAIKTTSLPSYVTLTITYNSSHQHLTPHILLQSCSTTILLFQQSVLVSFSQEFSIVCIFVFCMQCTTSFYVHTVHVFSRY
jgi:hypothetical protein